eukprot:sb/3468458/
MSMSVPSPFQLFCDLTSHQLTSLSHHTSTLSTCVTHIVDSTRAIVSADYSDLPSAERAVYEWEDEEARMVLMEEIQLQRRYIEQVDLQLALMEGHIGVIEQLKKTERRTAEEVEHKDTTFSPRGSSPDRRSDSFYIVPSNQGSPYPLHPTETKPEQEEEGEMDQAPPGGGFIEELDPARNLIKELEAPPEEGEGEMEEGDKEEEEEAAAPGIIAQRHYRMLPVHLLITDSPYFKKEMKSLQRHYCSKALSYATSSSPNH